MARMDGVLVVARFTVARRPLLKELRHVLDSSRASFLGVVLVAADGQDPAWFERHSYRGESLNRQRQQIVRTPEASPNGTNGTSAGANELPPRVGT
jgi:hypothetical protein